MYIIPILIAYLIGSIPTGIILGKIWKKKDIRMHGSGSIGATNITRTLGIKAGIIVLIIDILKGAIGVGISIVISDNEWISTISGLFVITGHIIPIFAKFRGGKGVATAIGVITIIYPLGLIGVLIGIITILFTRIVSLGSIVGSISCVVIMLISFIFIKNGSSIWDFIFFIIAGIIILISHHENILRLINGKENKILIKK
ncbi:MAG: acyl-phosphate glycerol 3-phosphate acyltransferase [Chloroflexi bacterium]|nr:acyl-phosphate glycerol 3-phosphate acyltransferase [Chloroflexota bacterium]